MFYSNICSSFSAAVLSELFRKWLYISVVVLVLAWPARPALIYDFITERHRVALYKKICEVGYENGKIYLLNTDYDVPAVVKVISDGEEKTIILEPLKLKTI